MDKRKKHLAYLSPFVLVCIGGGVVALIGDLWWFIFDAMIRTRDFFQHEEAYSFVVGAFVLAIFLTFFGVYRYLNSRIAIYDAELLADKKKKRHKKTKPSKTNKIMID